MKTGIRKLIPALVLLVYLGITKGFSQYTDAGLSLIGTVNSSVCWADADNDGDLDVSVSGEHYYPSGNAQGMLYFLQNGAIQSSTSIPALRIGSMSWGDFNNDNLPDLLYAGENTSNIAGIDTVNASGTALYNYSSAFTPVKNASVDWGDYDNDGDYDVLISGQDDATNVFATLYRNDHGNFTDAGAGLPGIIDGKIGFVDYDLDMDLDVFIAGIDNNGNKYCRLWSNTNGEFSIAGDQFLNLKSCGFDWADFNNDGYPDLYLSGDDGSFARGMLYMNNGGSGFYISDTIVPGSVSGEKGFGDANNDGSQDVFCTSAKANPAYNTNVIYFNDGSDSLKPASFTVTPWIFNSCQLGDYDNDFDLDFVINGYNYGPGATQVMENTAAPTNSRPGTPQNLTAVVEGTTVTLHWDHVTDNNTPVNEITYNIYVGTVSQGSDVVSPLANIGNGFRKISARGYIQDTSWIIRGLPEGNYYWGVQSIDNSLTPSLFSSENTFEIRDRFSVSIYNENPLSTSAAIYFDFEYDHDYDQFLVDDFNMLISKNSGSGYGPGTYQTVFSDAFRPQKTIAVNDYNNDNLIELSLSGDYTGAQVLDSSIILFGSLDGSNYTILDSALAKNANFDYVIWSDLDNDGLQDMISSGRTTNLGVNDKPVTYILHNLGGGAFEEVVHTIRGFEECGAVTADFDNDLDADLVIYGRDEAGNLDTYLYTNNGNFSFSESLIPNNQLFRFNNTYNILTGDFDLNGELDVFLAGRSDQEDNYSRVLLNNNMSFSDANLPIRSWKNMSNYWADYDYDGDLDIYSVSTSTASDGVRLYLNEDLSLEEIEVNLNDWHRLSFPFMAVNIDGQNGLDFVMKYSNNYDYAQFFDNYASFNPLSTSPGNLGFDRVGLDVILSWDRLADCPGCTYNIWVGTHPDSVNIMSPMADRSNGFRYVIQPGNTYLNNSWKLSGLPVGTYYWSVQGVDQAYTGGPFAATESFQVSNINAEFTFDTVCQGAYTSFTDLTAATDAVVGWKWNFGDGSSSTIENPVHTYGSSGVYNVVLWAFSVSGDSAMSAHDVLVKAVPIADFTADLACRGLPTSFTNTTNNNGLTITDWYWEFGDGGISFVQHPGTHNYLNSGNYITQLVALADNACSDTVEHIVSVAEYPEAVIASNLPLTFCLGDSTVLSVARNDSYDYVWKRDGTNITGADSSWYTAWISGAYSAEVTNPVGNCVTLSAEATVTANSIPEAPTIIADGPVEFCIGDSVGLSVNHNPDYTYQWRFNGGPVGSNTNVFTARSQGSYSVDITNSAGCMVSSANSLVVTVHANPTIPTVSVNGAPVQCDGATVNLSVENDPLESYQWYNGAVNIGGATQNNYDASVTGDYSLRITNVEGCISQTSPVSITVNPVPASPTISLSGPAEFCDGSDVTLSVTEDPELTYYWMKDGGADGMDQHTHLVNSSGTYTLEVKNTFDCVTAASNSVVVIVNSNPDIPTVSVSRNTTLCDNEVITLSVTDDPSMVYQWMNTGSAISGAITNSYDPVVSGDYSLTLINGDGCLSETNPVAVTVNPTPAPPVITVDGATEFCDTESTELSVTFDPTMDYQWYQGGGAVGSNSNTHIANTSGDYSLEVINAFDCKATSLNTVSIQVNATPIIPTVNVGGETTFCDGGSVTLSVDNDPTLSYQWMDDAISIPGATSSSYLATASGNYRLNISNATGCAIETTPVAVTVNPIPGSPTINLSGPAEFCDGGDVTLSVTDDPALTYHWMKDGGTVGTDQNSHLVNATGTYTLEVRNTNCTATASNTVAVTVNSNPDIPTVSVSGNTTLCDDEVLTLSVTDDPLMVYQWMNTGSAIGGAVTNSYDPEVSGDYSLTLINGDGCISETNPVAVTVNPTPSSPTIGLSGPDTFCEGGNVTLSVTDDPALTYRWMKDGGTVGTDQNTHLVTTSGTYTLEVRNTSCVANASNTAIITVNSNPSVPTVNVEGATTFCEGGSVVLSVIDDATLDYQWMDDVISLAGETTNSFSATASGNYNLHITNGAGCAIETDPVAVTVNPSPASPTITADDPTEFCDNESVTLRVTEIVGITYQWLLNGGAVGTDQHSYTAFDGGDYTLEATNTGDCTSTSSNTVTVTVNASPTIPTVNVDGPTAFCEGDSVELSVEDDPSVSYQWMDGNLNISGATSSTYIAEATGDYKLRIINAYDCVAETQVVPVIADPAPTPPTIGYIGPTVFCDTDSLVLSVTDNPNYTYVWQLNGGTVGEDKNTYTAKASGNYTVNVQNLGDCFAESINSVDVTVNPSPLSPTLNLSGATEFCEGGSLTLSVADPGTDIYQWMYQFGDMEGETGTSVTVEETGTYKVQVTAEGNCTAFSQEIDVTVNEFPQVPVIASDNYELDGCQREDPVVLSVDYEQASVSYQWKRNGVSISGETNPSMIGYLEEGDYSIEVIKNNCSVESQSLTIRYGAMPDKPDIIATGPVVWYLACSDTTATEYRWYYNGARIEGATGRLYVAGSQEGRYEVAVSKDGSCFAMSDPIWIPLGTGIEEDPWANLEIYPNPTTGLFIIEMDNSIMGELIIDIFGETGQQIINIKFNKETLHFKTEIDLSGQPPAIYLIKLMLEQYAATRSLIVE